MATRVQVADHQDVDTAGRPVIYDEVFDEYLLTTDDRWATTPLRYCPWCGHRQRRSKRQRWFAELAALGLSADAPDLPSAYRSDAWWTAEHQKRAAQRSMSASQETRSDA